MMPDAAVNTRATASPSHVQAIRYDAREPIFHEGDEADALFVIETGVVILQRIAMDGSRLIHGLRFAGEVIGLAVDGRHIVGAVAARPTTLRRFPHGDLTDPDTARRLLTACTMELMRTSDQLMIVGSRTALGRVAAFLADIAERAAGGAATFVLPLTRAEMGDALGLTIETASRAMTRLKTLGVIALPRSDTVTITDLAGLRELAEGDGELARGRLVA